MQYHGIASYKFEYKLSTDTNWTTGTTTNSSNGSCDYTIEGLTSGKSYNIQVTVTDRAGNSGMTTNLARTTKAEKNPDGVINNITTDELIFPGSVSEIITDNVGKHVNYSYNLKEIKVPYKYSSWEQHLKPTGNEFWQVWAETKDYIFITSIGPFLELQNYGGYANGVGLLDSCNEALYGSSDFPVVSCRNIKVLDFLTLENWKKFGSTVKRSDKVTYSYYRNALLKFDENSNGKFNGYRVNWQSSLNDTSSELVEQNTIPYESTCVGPSLARPWRPNNGIGGCWLSTRFLLYDSGSLALYYYDYPYLGYIPMIDWNTNSQHRIHH